MKAGNGSHFVQAYNAQPAVDTEGSLLIVGQRVTDHANDRQELVPTMQAVDLELCDITQVLADSGFFSQEAVAAVDADGGSTVYAAVEKTGHHRTVADLEKKTDPPPPPPEASATVVTRHRLRTAVGRDAYKLRKETVGTVIGIIKQAMRFRCFSLRGKPKVSTEWTLVTLAYNVRRLFRLLADPARPQVGQIQACGV